MRQLRRGRGCVTPVGRLRSRALEPGKGHDESIIIAVRGLYAVACVIACAIADPAHADGTGVIAAQSPDRAAVAEALTAAIEGRATRLVGDAVGEARYARGEGAVSAETLALFGRVRDQIDAGWREYLRVAVETAAVKLAAARADAERLVALPGGAELYADAALRLGAVLGHLGRDDEARAVLALALALDPDRPITLAEFSPDVVERIEAARGAAVTLSTLRVTSSPPGANVTIDGRGGSSAGPAAVTTVPVGQHIIVATAPGYLPLVRSAAVAPAMTTEVELVLEADEDSATLAAGATPGLAEAPAQRLIDATLLYADLDEVIVATTTTRRGGPTLLVQRCAGIPARCSAVVDVGYADPSGLAAAAREAWASVRTGELRYAPTVLADREDGARDDDRCRACRSPWLWGGVAAAVVVGAVVTVFAVSGSDPVPTLSVDGSQFRTR